MTVLSYSQPKISTLTILVSQLLASKDLVVKIDLLRRSSKVFLSQFPSFDRCLQSTSLQTQQIILSILAIGEGSIVFREWEKMEDLSDAFEKISKILQPVESFYDMLGGIVGYHLTLLKLLKQKENTLTSHENYQEPLGINLTEESFEIKQAIRAGIEKMSDLAEIYPIGGAGDRLNLIDFKTGEPLPAAVLPFCGTSLLELLIRDLQAREFLYKKLHGKSLVTPIVLMTSHEKRNDEKIREIFEDHQWFGRPKELFYFIIQPLVPVLTQDGHWSMRDIFSPYLKPGGHGVLWKLAKDQGAFDWLKRQKRKKALVRQINNPIAGTDYGLLAFAGYGCLKDKQFGFAACPRVLHAAEGTNVLVETIEKGEYQYRLSNVEYTDFIQKGIKEVPICEGSSYSRFPANTNILFVDLATIEQSIPLNPVPGMLVNLKNEVPFVSAEGEKKKIKGGRLESTMQNISDTMVFKSSRRLDREAFAHLPVFLTYGERNKTISVTKCAYKGSGKILETPEGCFYQMMHNHRELLQTCGMEVPEERTEEDYLRYGPEVLFLFHPALGPPYRIIQQKIRGGRAKEGAEIQIELAEIEIEELVLEGSFLVKGDLEKSRCRLSHVQVANAGIDREVGNVYWKNTPKRKEALEIVLEGTAEFEAENIVFYGHQEIKVPSGVRCIAYQEGKKVFFRNEKITSPSWTWKYNYDAGNDVKLSRSLDFKKVLR